MTFSELRIDQHFFDPTSGETWIKTDPATAVYDSGGDAFEGESDTFHPNDVIELEQTPMLKPFTAEGRFECGFNEITQGKRCALFAVRQEHGIGLGLAVAEEPGYHTIPLHWCNSDDFEQMSAHADDLNRELFGLEPKAAGLIVASTMRPLARREHMNDPPCDPATDWTRTVYLEAYATESGDGPAYARVEVRLSRPCSCCAKKRG